MVKVLPEVMKTFQAWPMHFPFDFSSFGVLEKQLLPC